MPAVQGEPDVVREERRPEPPHEAGTRSNGHVDDRQRLRRRAERDPERATGRVERDMPRPLPDRLARDRASAREIERHDHPSAGIRYVRVPAVGMPGRVARLAEVVEHVRDGQRRRVDERDRADVRVRNTAVAPTASTLRGYAAVGRWART
jgi:hypothetical protein